MNIQQYISSGIIESYLLGLVSDEESAELENLCRIYPELNVEIQHCQQLMERKMYDEPACPPEELKQRILQVINRESKVDPVPGYTFINIAHKDEDHIIVHRMWRYAVIILFILLQVTVLLAIFYYLKYRELHELQGVPKAPHTTQGAPA